MGEFKRADSLSAAEAAERDSRAEALLVDGLDHYFAGRYHDAIHLWTRVLFLDRSHARARAYIDRARTALAERQRRADEILHVTDDLVDRGDVGEARRLLTEAVAMGGEDERVAVLHTRLDRLERARAGVTVTPATAAILRVRPPGRWRRGFLSTVALVSAAAVGALLVTVWNSPAAHEWLREQATAPTLAPAALPAALPVLSREDVALIRARTLFAHGRLAEALEALERVEPGSTARATADQLRVEIQQLLLNTRPLTSTPMPLRSTIGQP